MFIGWVIVGLGWKIGVVVVIDVVVVVNCFVVVVTASLRAVVMGIGVVLVVVEFKISLMGKFIDESSVGNNISGFVDVDWVVDADVINGVETEVASVVDGGVIGVVATISVLIDVCVVVVNIMVGVDVVELVVVVLVLVVVVDSVVVVAVVVVVVLVVVVVVVGTSSSL